MRGVISFAYDYNDLEDGVLFSLNLERDTVFYLNKNALNRKKINYNDSFLQIVKFFNSKV
jgi:hypothetical protein